MLYLKPLAIGGSPTAMKRLDRSKQCHCLQFAQNKISFPKRNLFVTEQLGLLNTYAVQVQIKQLSKTKQALLLKQPKNMVFKSKV